MPTEPNSPETLRQEALAFVEERKLWAKDAVEVVSGDREADPLEVFPEATSTRDDAEPMDLTEDQQTRLREVAGRFGIVGEVDVVSNAEHHIIEGGKVWKVEAELGIAGDAQTLIHAGSPHRMIGEDEIEYIQTKFGHNVSGMSEVDMTEFVARSQDDFEALEHPEVLPFGYKVEPGFELVQDATGQLVKIGTNKGRDVLILRVDQDSPTPPFSRPNSSDLMSFISDVLTASGDENSGVAIDTSTTYASRSVDVVKSGLQRARNFSVGMYGRQMLADVRGLPVAEPSGINQIPGELHTYYSKLLELESALNS